MFKVYWSYAKEAHFEDFHNMSEALDKCEFLRKAGRTFVTMVSENTNQVGKMGVDAVTNGKTPDGIAYTWVKRR